MVALTERNASNPWAIIPDVGAIVDVLDDQSRKAAD